MEYKPIKVNPWDNLYRKHVCNENLLKNTQTVKKKVQLYARRLYGEKSYEMQETAVMVGQWQKF